ncbi:hypothetical protein L0156_16560 [bacterium]|nr:hypothetical protein [bacterium]
MQKVEIDLQLNLPLGELIHRLGPLNNDWRSSSGLRRLELMWEIGNLLVQAGVKNIHPVAWSIQKRSYITRTLLSYSFLIRKRWKNRNDLSTAFSGIRDYSLVREAFPFLLGKYQLKDQEREGLIKLLNSENREKTRQEIARLKKEKIGITKMRAKIEPDIDASGRRIHEIEKRLHRILFKGAIDEIRDAKNRIGEGGLLYLAQLCMAIGRCSEKLPQKPTNTETWPDFAREVDDILRAFVTASKEKKAKYYKVIGQKRLLRLADWFNSWRTESGVVALRSRAGANIMVDRQD